MRSYFLFFYFPDFLSFSSHTIFSPQTKVREQHRIASFGGRYGGSLSVAVATAVSFAGTDGARRVGDFLGGARIDPRQVDEKREIEGVTLFVELCVGFVCAFQRFEVAQKRRRRRR